ncbi:uncharacterized protein TM35_000045190 [Trypanosoma theileri]|uniref:CCHC-type domain-containing protein n=1 Tax=Trypanosoma theileri TaxID=67003 RepID=A0A1X0P601_9TRYP|nr:uncharacterized protein TM35_000045190 [Trypanosoma theileri]ORC92305.1 hypothetical protein TM35_000045190 [Trypanosoma theileri]
MPQYSFHVDGLLILDGDALKVKIGQEDFMDLEALRPSIINFTMRRNQKIFLQVFETTYNLFSAEWAALGEEASKLHYEYECATAQLEREDFSVQQTANTQLQDLQYQLTQISQQAYDAQMLSTHMKTQLQETQAQLAKTQAQLAASRVQCNQTLGKLRKMQKQHTATQARLGAALEKLNEKGQQSVPDTSHTTAPIDPPQKGRNLSSWAWKSEPALPTTEERPKLGICGIQELRQPIWTESCRPEEKIRTFEGLMEFLMDASPSELPAAYQRLFPRPVNPGLFFNDVWNNFVQWLDSVRNEGISAQLIQMGRQVCTQLRVIQTVKDNPGLKVTELTQVMEEPQLKEDPFLQVAAKIKRKHSAPPPSKARCFRCGRVGHYSTTCRVNLQKETYKPKNDYRPRKQ